MLSLARVRIVCTMAALAVPAAAAAHGFGRLYNLPVPFWLYAWGAASALLLSFVVAGYFAAAPGAAPTPIPASRDLSDTRGVRALRRVLPALRALGVFLLLLCIATGFFGNRDPLRNFSMTFFWVVFVLGFTYVTVLFGDVFAALNPWRTMTDAVERFAPGGLGRVRYPERLGDWPALAFYLSFIWIELFGHGKPSSLAAQLLAYTAINFAGVRLIGAAAWFRHCEFFSVYLRLVSLMSPLDYRRADVPGERGTVRLRRPFAGLVDERPARMSTVVFSLAMLSTTAFDGLRSTQWWVGLFWNDPSGIVTALAGARPVLAYAVLRPWYIGWETFWLLASPFIYLGAYLAFIALATLVKRRARAPDAQEPPMRELALDFAFALLPIALVYNIAHYATLILTQGLKIVSLASDPFGWGWNLFGTAGLLRAPILPAMGLIWHSQVALILCGHIVSIFAAHLIALRVFPTRRQALLSQLPMLALMVAFTVAGLWILAQPLTAMLMR